MIFVCKYYRIIVSVIVNVHLHLRRCRALRSAYNKHAMAQNVIKTTTDKWLIQIPFKCHHCVCSLGDLKLVEKPSPLTLAPHDFANIKANVKVASTENGIIFGNIGTYFLPSFTVVERRSQSCFTVRPIYIWTWTSFSFFCSIHHSNGFEM